MSLRPRARIHLNNIVENWRTLRAAQPSSRASAAIKADAYGHGLERVASALHDAGCDHFFVAHLHEAELARKALGPHPQIFVLNGPAPGEHAAYTAHAINPVVNSKSQFETLIDWLQNGAKLRDGYCLHFDTGMNRLGLPYQDAAKMAAATAELPPNLIMSHLSCADDRDAPLNMAQCEAFQTVREAFPDCPASLSNSDGLWLGTKFHHDLSRLGIGLYGGGHPPAGTTLKPGMTLEAPILQIRPTQAGAPIGYGASQVLEKDTVLATVALGYGDGFPRSASNSGFAMLGDERCPIVGRVSMDLTILDVSSALDLARPGVFAQFIGDRALVSEQARCAGTIDYELTTGLTHRVVKQYDEL